MAHTSSAHQLPSDAGARPEARELLFKPDRPRAIDRHIDFFGGVTEAPAESDDDRSADAFLEALA
jgi:hypothetical protein